MSYYVKRAARQGGVIRGISYLVLTTFWGCNDPKPVFWTFQIFFNPHIHQRRNDLRDSESLITVVRPEYDVIKHGYVPTYKVGIYLQKTVIWRGHGGLSWRIRLFGGASQRGRGTSKTFFLLRLGMKIILWPPPGKRDTKKAIFLKVARLEVDLVWTRKKRSKVDYG